MLPIIHVYVDFGYDLTVIIFVHHTRHIEDVVGLTVCVNMQPGSHALCIVSSTDAFLGRTGISLTV